MLLDGQWTHLLIRVGEGAGARDIEVAVVIHAPVVHRDRKVIGEGVRRGKSEIDDARKPTVDEQRVVAKQVAVDRALRQSASGGTALDIHLAIQQFELLRSQE